MPVVKEPLFPPNSALSSDAEAVRTCRVKWGMRTGQAGDLERHTCYSAAMIYCCCFSNSLRVSGGDKVFMQTRHNFGVRLTDHIYTPRRGTLMMAA